jgi:hypothetical protein
MIDVRSGERVVVAISEKYGPYIRILSYDDAGALEDVFDDHYYILYWKSVPEDLTAQGGCEYYFGNAADPEKIQAILDDINFD